MEGSHKESKDGIEDFPSIFGRGLEDEMRCRNYKTSTCQTHGNDDGCNLNKYNLNNILTLIEALILQVSNALVQGQDQPD
jgi:hypothetical protein